ncbi:kynurenine formamidase isoform X1 [Trachemys scripta elegans]|uniref:kynurenine formamidase isoform X1 n=1 Tax=Trachemys scripta elegans TaxID=31138 RepID=UPI0015556925|nr:kynurenine formamidase isoform X1 [Trachemys scripta elegans]
MGTWRDMTKEELEKQYAPSRWSHRMDKEVVIEAHVRAVTEGTRRAQATMQTLLHVPYGGNDGEKLDIYLPTDPSGAFPLVLYIHGGYWQFLSKEVSGFIAPPLVTQGIAVVAVGYDVAPKGHLDVMVAQVRRSVAFIVQQYSKISGVYLCGHSAGAHLAAMVLSTDWEEYGVTPDIKGAFLVSGVYDLEPITHTSVNNRLHMSRSDCSAVTLSLPREVAWRNSPILGVTAATPARKACEVLIAVAQHDSPEFHRQSQEYFQALRSAGWRVSLLDIADTDHFDVIEKLSQGGYILTQVILNMISRA